MDQLNLFWSKALDIIENEIASIPFETWFRDITPYSIEENILYLQVKTTFAKEIIEKKYWNLLVTTLATITQEMIQKTYEIILISKEDKIMKPIIKDKNLPSNQTPKNLNPKYIFSTFVVGNSNRMAHAAALAVAESPAQNYNPLFLYGNSGLGKTHLMHSIAHFILEQNSCANVLYVTSETFTNELITSIQKNKNELFRNRYRNIDVLLIDDIQFISKKEGTQEEFFHTFNALYESSKQIIISSDRPPKEIETLEDRLRSRFEMGLIADIQAPDYETRIAILRKKAETDQLKVPNEVMSYIAKNIASNIRELEGALTRIVAYSKLTNENISIHLAEHSLKNLFHEQKNSPLNPLFIQEIVCNHFNIRMEDIQSSKKTKNIVFPRQIAMYLCRKLLDISLPKIGDSFGGRDHSTVIHAISRIEKQREIDASLDDVIKQIELDIKI